MVTHWEVSGLQKVDPPHAHIGSLWGKQVIMARLLHEAFQLTRQSNDALILLLLPEDAQEVVEDVAYGGNVGGGLQVDRLTNLAPYHQGLLSLLAGIHGLLDRGHVLMHVLAHLLQLSLEHGLLHGHLLHVLLLQGVLLARRGVPAYLGRLLSVLKAL